MWKSSIVPLPVVMEAESSVLFYRPGGWLTVTISYTYLSFTERFSPPASSVLVASEIQNCDFPSYRGIQLDIPPSGCERVQAFDPNGKRGEIWTIDLVQRWELAIVEGRIGGCTWSCGDDFRCAGDGVFGDDL